MPFKILRARLDALLQSRGERASPHKLLFQSWRQLVFLCKSWRKIALLVVVPSAHNLTVIVVIEMFTLVVIIPGVFLYLCCVRDPGRVQHCRWPQKLLACRQQSTLLISFSTSIWPGSNQTN